MVLFVILDLALSRVKGLKDVLCWLKLLLLIDFSCKSFLSCLGWPCMLIVLFELFGPKPDALNSCKALSGKSPVDHDLYFLSFSRGYIFAL